MVAGSKPEPSGETLLFNEEQLGFLAERGVIYLTERPDGRYGAIIAHDFRMATRLAECRRADEKVIGLMGAGFLHHLGGSAVRRADRSRADGVGSLRQAGELFA
jgi:hypothetical protein